jgi:probable nitrogen fixation protein
MSADATAAFTVVDADARALASPFVRALVRQMRAHDISGTWERKSDLEVLERFIVTPEQRRSLPVIADPDARTLWRVEQYYSALGLAIEQASGVMAVPMLKITHEGFGRVVLVAGKLVVISRILRDVHRFGFASFAALAAGGEKLIAEAVKTIETYPEVARA